MLRRALRHQLALCGFRPRCLPYLFAGFCRRWWRGRRAVRQGFPRRHLSPPTKPGQAFAMYGLAVVCAPAIGPTLGGTSPTLRWPLDLLPQRPHSACCHSFLTSRHCRRSALCGRSRSPLAEGRYQARLPRLRSAWLCLGSLESAPTRARRTTGSPPTHPRSQPLPMVVVHRHDLVGAQATSRRPPPHPQTSPSSRAATSPSAFVDVRPRLLRSTAHYPQSRQLVQTCSATPQSSPASCSSPPA